jgi:choline kinase
MMQAIILAAGRGSRMKNMTDAQPKCLVKLGGKTLLEWQTEALSLAGFSDITIVRGYCKNALQNTFYRYVDNPKWEETNMVYSLSCADHILRNQSCLISYSDIVYHPHIVKQLMTASGDIVITYDESWELLWKLRFENPLDDAEVFQIAKDGLKAIGLKAKIVSEIHGQYMGLLKISPKGWDQINNYLCSIPWTDYAKLDMTSLLHQLIQQGIRVDVVPIQGRWCEVDSMKDLYLYESNLQKGSWSHDWRVSSHGISKFC